VAQWLGLVGTKSSTSSTVTGIKAEATAGRLNRDHLAVGIHWKRSSPIDAIPGGAEGERILLARFQPAEMGPVTAGKSPMQAIAVLRCAVIRVAKFDQYSPSAAKVWPKRVGPEAGRVIAVGSSLASGVDETMGSVPELNGWAITSMPRGPPFGRRSGSNDWPRLRVGLDRGRG
jgi:hypothetical protein